MVKKNLWKLAQLCRGYNASKLAGKFFYKYIAYTQFALPELRYEGLRGGDSYITVGLRV